MFFSRKSKSAASPAAVIPSKVNGGNGSIGDEGRPPPADTPAPLDAQEANRRAAAAKRFAATLGEVISILMRSPQHKRHTLADLEWLVLPALLAGQFSVTIAQSKTDGRTAPVGVVLWASVSDEIDKRLNAAPQQTIRLKPEEWKSGDNVWVVAAAGDGRVIRGMLQRLREKDWAGKKAAKVIAETKEGKSTVATLVAKAA
jgi:cytolysin-activating lysine-acyltransferase